MLPIIAGALFGQTSTDTWVNAPRLLRLDDLDRLVDVPNAAVYKSGAADLIRQTIGIEPRDLTFLIHVVRWSEGGEIVRQNWYVFRNGQWTDAQFTAAKRIYGRGQVWLLYLQFNARSNVNTTYVIETKKKSAAAVDHLQSAAGLFGVSMPMLGSGEARNIWNARLLTIPYLPSDVVITPKFGGAAATFDNEGLSRFDFSAAVPVTKTDSAGLYALANFYVHPVDVKSAMSFDAWPHLVEGVWVGNRPLKHILLGIGWGPIYGGVTIGGGTYTYSFGLNISASSALGALKKQ